MEKKAGAKQIKFIKIRLEIICIKYELTEKSKKKCGLYRAESLRNNYLWNRYASEKRRNFEIFEGWNKFELFMLC